jgi:hypothetical protein
MFTTLDDLIDFYSASAYHCYQMALNSIRNKRLYDLYIAKYEVFSESAQAARLLRQSLEPDYSRE